MAPSARSFARYNAGVAGNNLDRVDQRIHADVMGFTDVILFVLLMLLSLLPSFATNAALLFTSGASDLLVWSVCASTAWTLLGVLANRGVPDSQVRVQVAEGRFRAAHSNVVEFAEQVRTIFPPAARSPSGIAPSRRGAR